MDARLPTLLLIALLASPAGAQTCKKVPPPFLPGLFPESVRGMALEFASDPMGGCRAMYRPESASARQSRPWAMVTIEVNPEANAGESPESVVNHFTALGTTMITLADWPVAMRAAPLGEEFITLKGSVRVILLVKNGDQGDASRALATAVFAEVLPKIPCG